MNRTCSVRDLHWAKLSVGSLFLFVSLPFVYVCTLSTVYSGKVSFAPVPLFEDLGIPLLSVNGFRVLSAVTGILAAAFAFSLGGRLIAILFWTSLVYILGHYESFWHFQPELFASGTVLPIWCVAVMIFFPFESASGGQVSATPLGIMKLIPVAMFFSAGVSKILASGFAWVDAGNIGLILRYRYLLTDSSAALWLSEAGPVLKLVGPLVLAFELLGGLWFLLAPRHQYVYGSVAVLFLVGTYFVMGIDEFLLLFLPFFAVYFLPEASPGLWSGRRAF